MNILQNHLQILKKNIKAKLNVCKIIFSQITVLILKKYDKY